MPDDRPITLKEAAHEYRIGLSTLRAEAARGRLTTYHRRQHEIGEAHFWSQWGIDPIFKAMALWINSGDIEAGEEIAKNR